MYTHEVYVLYLSWLVLYTGETVRGGEREGGGAAGVEEEKRGTGGEGCRGVCVCVCVCVNSSTCWIHSYISLCLCQLEEAVSDKEFQVASLQDQVKSLETFK